MCNSRAFKVLCLLLFFVNVSYAIITRTQEISKPSYTSGIKTKNWQQSDAVQTHQNYSKVHVHNQPDAQYIITQTERTIKLYPVYNGHSYGPRAETNTPNVSTGESRAIYKRKIEYKTLNVYERCPSGETGQFVYSLSCNQYLNCWKGRGSPQNCAPGTLFNPKTLECDFPSKVECLTGPRENTLGRRVSKSVRQATCPDDFTGLIPNYTDCSKFINCNAGQAYSMDCAPGTLFDMNRNICDHPNHVACFNGQNQGATTQSQSGHFINTECSSNCDSSNRQGIKIGNAQRDFTSDQHVYTGGYHGQGQIPSGSKYYGTTPTQTQGQNSYGQGQNSYDQGQNSYGQGHTYSYQGHGTTTQCDPTRQNCGQGNIVGSSFSEQGVSTQGQGQGQIYRGQVGTIHHNHGYGGATAGQTSQVHGQVVTRPCNPQTQNCGISYGTGSSGQSGQSTGYSYDYGQVDSQQARCDPSTQNCASSIGQATNTDNSQGRFPFNQQGQVGSQVYPGVNYQSQGSTSGLTYGQATNTGSSLAANQQEQGGRQTYHNQGSSQPETSSCNPFLQNCNAQSRTTARPQYNYSQSGNGQTRCNPFLQNCNENYGTAVNSNIQIGRTEHATKATSGQVSCNPFLQNCNQYSGSPSQSETTQQSSYSHNQTPSKCNPFVQNCNQHITSTAEPNRRYSECDPSIQNCNRKPNCTGHSCPNYDTICNINEPNCRGSHQIIAKSTEYSSPKCPDGYQGITKHPWDCKKFLNCANGMTFVQDCAPGALFNPALGNCDFEYNVKCTVEGISVQETGDYGRHETASSTYRPVTPYTQQYQGSSTGSSNYVHRNQGGFTQRQSQIDSVTEGPNLIQNNNNLDYIDVFNPNEQSFGFKSTTPRTSSKQWPPPYPDSDDYEFEYEDGEPVTLKPKNIFYGGGRRETACQEKDFHCTAGICVDRSSVCDGHRDCYNGLDETNCQEYTGRFDKQKNYRLEVLEKQKWINVTANTCAYLCVHNTDFNCRSFNYRKLDKTCFLSDMNVGLTGTLRLYYPMDYFELKTATIHCSDQSRYFECPTKKCITRSQLCDGVDDCGDRADEKSCRKENFGYSVRLAGSTNKNEGRVEITAFGKTGYICDDKFDISDANVVCRELGFELGAVEVKGQSFYATDLKVKDVSYLMDDLDCIGNETSLLDCDFSGWGVHNCRDLEIVGVECKTPQDRCGQNYWRCKSGNECVPISFVCDDLYDCTDESDEKDEFCKASTEIRLVNGSNPREGRLEIKHHGVWGTVCDDDFNEDAAKVVCKHLGFKGTPVIKKEAYFGSGAGPIWLDQVSCYGNETSIENCTLWGWGEHNCVHDEDVGVICNAKQELIQVPAERHSQHVFSADSPFKLSAEGKCGFRKDNQFLGDDLVHARVVNGYTARAGDYPWQAAIKVKVKDKSAHWCGAIVISSKWVLTAAHCLKGYAKSAYVVVAGEYNTDENEGTEQQKYIEEFFIHENFRKGHKMNNDIALIKLKGTGFILNDDVQPICLPDIDALYNRELNCTISGFGSVKSGIASYSHNLMAAWIPIHREEICKMPHIYGDAISEGMLCAGFLDGGVDACDGDSGGPLACLDRGVFTLYGITSWGQHCGYANKPGVYVKVAHYRKWIDDVINKYSS